MVVVEERERLTVELEEDDGVVIEKACHVALVLSSG